MPRFLLSLLIFSGLFSLRAQTVLVIPFFNESHAANLDWIGESICESVRESLDSEGILALDREERLEAFRRLSLRPNAVLTLASVIKAGEALDASVVIYGHYQAAPGTLRISGRLINLKKLRQEPEFTESGALEDLATLETHLSWQALQAIAPRKQFSQTEFLRGRPHVRLDALESYIRGLLASAPEQQHHFFTQAARLDPSYSQPCFQLGKSFWLKKDYRSAASWLQRVTRGDPRYLEAQFFLGLCRYHGGDFAGAETCFETVAATVPLNEVYNNLGAAQAHNNPEAAIGSFRKAVEGDDTDPDYHYNLASALWRAGQFEAAAHSLRAALERNPNDDDAAALLIFAERREASRPGSETKERLKTNYEETAFRQLKAELESKKE